jgi:hypothetical protein
MSTFTRLFWLSLKGRDQHAYGQEYGRLTGKVASPLPTIRGRRIPIVIPIGPTRWTGSCSTRFCGRPAVRRGQVSGLATVTVVRRRRAPQPVDSAELRDAILRLMVREFGGRQLTIHAVDRALADVGFTAGSFTSFTPSQQARGRDDRA